MDGGLPINDDYKESEILQEAERKDSLKTTSQIRKELKKLIRSKKQKCFTEQQKNNAVNEARKEINLKYGNDWRGRELTGSKGKEPSIYDGHTFGEHWMD